MESVSGYKVEVFVADSFALDGGAMFGSVPKTLWSKRIKSDEANRIPLVCRLLILRGHGRVILIDTGCGAKWDEKYRNIYSIKNKYKNTLSEVLPDVTDVILTHLHFDHAGGITHLDKDGKVALSFPKANIYLPKANWERARKPGVREKAAYLPQNILPLECANLHLVGDGEEFLPGIKALFVHGHTQGLQTLFIEGKEGVLYFPSDLIPTSHHIPVPYVMGYDLCAEKSMEEKFAILTRAVSENWVILFEHDAEIAASTVILSEEGDFLRGNIVNMPALVV